MKVTWEPGKKGMATEIRTHYHYLVDPVRLESQSVLIVISQLLWH